MRRARKRAFGFTVVELLVGMVILVLLNIALIAIYRAGLTTAEHTSGRAALQQQARLLMDRMITLVSTAVRQDTTSDPLFYPSTANLNTPSTRLDWRSATDLFNGLRVEEENVAANDFRTLKHHAYRISWLDPDTSVRLTELNINTLAPLTTPPPQTLAQHIDSLTFNRIDTSIISVQIRVSNIVAGRYHTGDLMRRMDASQDADGVAGGHRRVYTLESAVTLPVFTGIF